MASGGGMGRGGRGIALFQQLKQKVKEEERQKEEETIAPTVKSPPPPPISYAPQPKPPSPPKLAETVPTVQKIEVKAAEQVKPAEKKTSIGIRYRNLFIIMVNNVLISSITSKCNSKHMYSYYRTGI
jgi:hypothetical protein